MRVENRPERRGQAGLPVDQRAVAIERQRLEALELERRHAADDSGWADGRGGVGTNRGPSSSRRHMNTRRRSLALLLLGVVLAACSGAGAAPSVAPSASPSA